jgi:hypothetical protein
MPPVLGAPPAEPVVPAPPMFVPASMPVPTLAASTLAPVLLPPAPAKAVAASRFGRGGSGPIVQAKAMLARSTIASELAFDITMFPLH